jgi:hypothetical protein
VRDNPRGGFYSTLARITWIDGGWVGLDHGIEGDYGAADEPRLTTAHPLVFAHHAHHIAVRNLHLEGNRADNQAPMDGCRGGAIYFAKSVDVEVSDVTERDYYGEGISFQMCRDVRILRSTFNDNTGNGLHPGAGSTKVLFDGCTALRNQRAGFFFCVRANHITVRHCHFEDNDHGVSIGTRDCYNLLEQCTITRNHGPAIFIRQSPAPVEVHSILIRQCALTDNGTKRDAAQLELEDDAHDIIAEQNTLSGKLGVRATAKVQRLFLAGNQNTCATPEALLPANVTRQRPAFAHGYDAATPTAWRHLPTA